MGRQDFSPLKIWENLNRPYAEVWLEHLRKLPKCDWCGEDDRAPNRIGLCGACSRTQKKTAAAERRLRENAPSANGHELFLLRRELAIWQKAEELCKADGCARELIVDATDLGAADLETWFVRIASELGCDTTLYDHKATQLGWTFTPSQRNILAYLLWKAMLVKGKKRRRQMASRELLLAPIWLAEQNRLR